jgi:dihydroneopterin aldolase
MDTLEINQIRAYGYTGYFPEEQRLGQWFEVNLVFWLDLSQAGETDDLNDTVDYSQVVRQVQAMIETSKFQTIERLAATIAQALLTQHCLKQVKVRLTKCQPPIPNFSGHVTIELVRSKPDDRIL